MITQIKLKDQILTLPKSWKCQDIFVRESDDVIIIKKVEKQAFWKTWDKIGFCVDGIKKNDIENAINSARKK